MGRNIEHAYIQEKFVEQNPEPKMQPDALEIITNETPLYTEFEPLGDTSKPENLADAFHMQSIQDGTLYISKKTYVEDLEGNHIPRTLLVTPKGETLVKSHLGILKQIDERRGEERKSQAETIWTKNSRSGEVRVLQLKDGGSVAVKRFKRYEDGRKLYVGGLEQAEAHLRLNDSFSTIPDFPCRMADVYLASQDVVVMENIEQLDSLAGFLEKHPKAEAEALETVELINQVVEKAFEEKKLKGLYEKLLRTDPVANLRVKSVALKHLFVEKYDPDSKNISFVMIDPNI